jgi:hypothetical protein
VLLPCLGPKQVLLLPCLGPKEVVLLHCLGLKQVEQVIFGRLWTAKLYSIELSIDQ